MNKGLLGIAAASLMAAVAAAALGQVAPASAGRPNVVMILADDLGYADLSSYRGRGTSPGNDAWATSQTPRLDALAKQGMRFTQFYSGSAVCSPSRACLLTGRNNNRTGVFNHSMPLRSDEITIAEILKQQGYSTAHVGKWHLATKEALFPMAQGFDRAFWTLNNASPSHRNPDNFIDQEKPVGEIAGYSCQIVVDKAIDWLSDRPSDGGPFYMNVWFHEPHTPVAAPDAMMARHPRQPAYYGCIENMDLAIGRLLDHLDAQGLAQNTIVMFGSDNGSQVAGSNQPLRGEKCFNWEGGIRVPFIVRWPGRVPAGAVNDQPGSFADILPTLTAATGAQIPGDRTIDGESLLSNWTDPQAPFARKTPIFFYRYFHDPILMLREGNWVLLGYERTPEPPRPNYDEVELALIKPAEGAAKWSQWSYKPAHGEHMKQQQASFFELYDVSDDQSQRQNVADAHPDHTAAMKQRMLKLHAEVLTEGMRDQ